MIESVLAISGSAIRLAVPYTLAGLGGTYSERSGVVNIGLEGQMLTGAFTAVAVTNISGSPWLGLFSAVLAGMLLGLVHAVVSVTFKADQIVSGLAIIIFAAGITVFFSWLIFDKTQIMVEGTLRVPLLHDLPGMRILFSKLPPLVFITALVVAASHIVIFKTVFGLRLRSVGEHPQAADTLGIGVYKMRYLAVVISGGLAGMGGAYLSLEHAHYFVKGISGGRGFIGLASMIFGKWTPFGTAGAGLLFGFGEAIKPYLPKIIPSQFIDMIPYILTILVLASAIGRATPPAAIGVPYSKE
ncbi:MAG: ABC transporter permease [Deltaproteobacteria bacterium]|nr:ABC transporter permease [Deltaproteobacteria bacterium]MBW1961313.1 ABC transporter permease [Deltaproteobacteria bacterium]MBW1995340.1 ABC transporter permease [Deltaproteobacteria bacterium]MBW2151572.1 ABC transporter permease [Deltaproteobacteria bacterium]